jgi:hypothetical protein
MPLPEARPIREYERVDRALLDEEIRPSRQPAVLRGVASHWPAVRAALQSGDAIVGYLKRFSGGRRIAAIVGEPGIDGRFFYSDDLRGFNFQRGQSPLEPFLDRLLRDRDHPSPMAMAVQSEIIPDVLTGFETENRIDLVRPDVEPRAWIGNRIRVSPHFDHNENIGVVVAGRRRFTLFPPEQMPNMYCGPLELTPAGTPVSMVDPINPDLERFPRFADALKAALSATLEPGDAIYIPYHWWHGVESLAPFNFLVNYWWSDARTDIGRPYDVLIHAFFALKHLPPDQRAVWRTMFDHYVFEVNGDPAEHLPEHAKGVLGEPTPELLARMRATLKQIASQL